MDLRVPDYVKQKAQIIMKKYFIFLFFWFAFQIGFSQNQTIKLSFSGEDAATHNGLPLENVLIRNITVGCDTTIYGDNPSLVLTVPLGISDLNFSGSEPFILFPPVPNPFNGKSRLQILLNQGGTLQLTLLDAQSKVIADYKNDFNVGSLRFEIETSVNNFLLLNVSNGRVFKSAKLISMGNGTGNSSITYLGTDPGNLKTTSVVSKFSFRLGEQLLFTSIKRGYEDKIIYDSPAKDSTYTFTLTASIPNEPSVITFNVTDITSATAN
jgi:hypothetical protein